MIIGLIVLESINIYSANMQSSLWTASGGASAQTKVHLVRFMTPAVLIVTYVRLFTSKCFSDFWMIMKHASLADSCYVFHPHWTDERAEVQWAPHLLLDFYDAQSDDHYSIKSHPQWPEESNNRKPLYVFTWSIFLHFDTFMLQSFKFYYEETLFFLNFSLVLIMLILSCLSEKIDMIRLDDSISNEKVSAINTRSSWQLINKSSYFRFTRKITFRICPRWHSGG